MNRKTGQTLTESVILLPLFVGLIFLAVQCAHVGMGLIVINYAAASVARQAAQKDLKDMGSLRARLEHLMVAGMRLAETPTPKYEPGIAPTLTVTVCATVPAYPLIGEVLDNTVMSAAGSGCAPQGLSPVSLMETDAYRFRVRGQATVRMNYQS